MTMLQRRRRPSGVVAASLRDPISDGDRRPRSARAPTATGETAKATPAQRIRLRRLTTLGAGASASGESILNSSGVGKSLFIVSVACSRHPACTSPEANTFLMCTATIDLGRIAYATPRHASALPAWRGTQFGRERLRLITGVMCRLARCDGGQFT